MCCFQADLHVFLGGADVAGNVEVEFVFLDLGHVHATGVAGLLLAEFIGLNDLGDVFFGQLVLAFAFYKVLGRINEQDVVGLFAFLEHQNTYRNACRIEQISWQANYGIDMSVFEQLGADALFGTAAKQHAMRQDDGHHALVFEEVKAVQQEGKIRR